MKPLKLLVGLLVCSSLLFATSTTARATPPLMVVGAATNGFGTQVVIHARATGPLGFPAPAMPAEGFVKVRASSGDWTGSVSCIGLMAFGYIVVSGTSSLGGQDFGVLLHTGADFTPPIVFPRILGPVAGALGPCALLAFDLSRLFEVPELYADLGWVRGHINVIGG